MRIRFAKEHQLFIKLLFSQLPLDEIGTACWTDILNPNIADGDPAGDVGTADQY